MEDSDSEEDFQAYPQLNDDLSVPGTELPLINVVVTGFGPFAGHPINASAEVVKELKKTGLTHNVNLVTMEVPVTYDAVQIIVPRLWEEYKPQLVVHVGVSHLAEELTIEKLAHNCGYKSLDVNGKTAPSQCYSKTGAECLHTTLDVDKLCKDINDSSCLAMALPSTDAGRYLCEYIYYASLSHSTSSVMFIHVPKLNKPYTVAELADALRCAVLAALKQLNLLHSLPLPGKHVLEEIQRQNNQITKTRELL